MDYSTDGTAENNLISLRDAKRARETVDITFHRRELDAILKVYSRMVGMGEWRDYAIDHLKQIAVFSIFRHSSEMPLFRVIKAPHLARKQGAYSIEGADGRILKRGQDLSQVLKVFDRHIRLAEAKRGRFGG